MPSDLLPILSIYARHLIPYLFQLLSQRLHTLLHTLTYHPTTTPNSSPKQVIVIGASFAGLSVARRLTETLPSGWQVLVIEKNEDLHWVFAFPRLSVLGAYEEMAFVPWRRSKWWRRAERLGVGRAVTGTVRGVSDGKVLVQVADGETERIKWDVLVLATGCDQTAPARLRSEKTVDAERELSRMQEKVKSAQRIAVVGGGAVGVELVGNVKSVYPDKEVTLIRSRGQLLNAFGKRLHVHALTTLEKLGVKVWLGERPVLTDVSEDIAKSAPTLVFSDGRIEEFDLIIPCTGQRPNSALVQELAPASISKQTQRILVSDKLQLCDPEGNIAHPAIFALGDVAETGAPKMARAAMIQAEVVVQNILSIVRNRVPAKVYTCEPEIEGSIKLTLGLKQIAMWMRSRGGRELMLISSKGKEDLDMAMGWRWYGPGAKHMPTRETA